MSKIKEIVEALDYLSADEVREVRLALSDRLGGGPDAFGTREPRQPKSPILTSGVEGGFRFA